MDHAKYLLDRGGKVVVSLGGARCPINCAHCYVFAPGFQFFPSREPEHIVRDLESFGSALTAVYLSGDIEPFLEPQAAVTFLAEASQKLDCDLLFTTRLIIEHRWFPPLREIADRQFAKGRLLVGCVSIPAWDSYRRIERSRRVAAPAERVQQLGRFLTDLRIPTMLAARPILPAEVVSPAEYGRLIRAAAPHSTVVLGETLFLDTDGVLERRLGISVEDSPEIAKMSFFDQEREWKVVDLREQVDTVASLCQKLDKPFYLRSMPGIELIRGYWDRDRLDLNLASTYPLPVPDFEMKH
ncbi:hypothetical protein [Plantactinospora sp. KLBMP9567]|uniref:hypothetical protein n=1 Tax=Plantactinospora sp. KLBMP9567 TaxID=3085900 RepID=UPI002980A494|nr:hypothetical protein [Plantactinospora sp. KLBMP9567]MDW5327856.1 hypothetical protein [Plantactinospora sp. KLBMP9567]